MKEHKKSDLGLVVGIIDFAHRHGYGFVEVLYCMSITEGLALGSASIYKVEIRDIEKLYKFDSNSFPVTNLGTHIVIYSGTIGTGISNTLLLITLFFKLILFQPIVARCLKRTRLVAARFSQYLTLKPLYHCYLLKTVTDSFTTN